MSTGPEPGWYHADGDPPGTQRYWDGMTWQGDPQPVGMGTGFEPDTINTGSTSRGLIYGRFWPRAFAALIDAIIVAVPFVIILVTQIDWDLSLIHI